jgi:hypothetical protein
VGATECAIRFLDGRHTVEDFEELIRLPAYLFADDFPTVPRPQARYSLNLLAIRWKCRDLRYEQMPCIATELLAQGLDSPSLRRLAGEINLQSRADIEDIVKKSFSELSVSYPISEEHAKIALSIQIAREAIAGLKNPWIAARQIESLQNSSRNADPCFEELKLLNDEPLWDAGYGRPLLEITADLITVLANIGAMAVNTPNGE